MECHAVVDYHTIIRLGFPEGLKRKFVALCAREWVPVEDGLREG